MTDPAALAPCRAAPAAATMRVLMTTDAVGGVWTYAVDLARGLTDYGLTVTLAVLGPAPDEAQRALAEAIAGLDVVETRLPLDWLAEDRRDLDRIGREIAALADETAADLVHLNSPALAASGRFAAPVLGACHSCLATWWSACGDGPMPPDFAWRTRALRDGLAACDLLVAPTRAFAQAIAETYRLPPPRVVHNGRRPAPAGQLERGRFILAAGRLWDEGKGLRLLLDAAPAVDAAIRVAGPLVGPNGQRAPSEGVEALGPLSPDELRAWMDRAPIFVSPALYEPFGLSVLEAAQAGCALVLSDIPTFRELWSGAAVFTPAGDAAALAEALQALLDDPGRQRRLGQAARRRAADYGVERMRAGVLDLYREMTVAVPGRREAAA